MANSKRPPLPEPCLHGCPFWGYPSTYWRRNICNYLLKTGKRRSGHCDLEERKREYKRLANT